MSHTRLRCECCGNHNPNNTEPDLHHIVPLSWGGPDTEANLVALCPNGHRLVHQLLRAYRRAGGVPSWLVCRHFSTFTRDLAARGWAGSASPTKETP